VLPEAGDEGREQCEGLLGEVRWREVWWDRAGDEHGRLRERGGPLGLRADGEG